MIATCSFPALQGHLGDQDLWLRAASTRNGTPHERIDRLRARAAPLGPGNTRDEHPVITRAGKGRGAPPRRHRVAVGHAGGGVMNEARPWSYDRAVTHGFFRDTRPDDRPVIDRASALGMGAAISAFAAGSVAWRAPFPIRLAVAIAM